MDKLLGCYVGGILGDALGHPHELRGSVHHSQYTGRLQFPCVKSNRFSKESRSTKVGMISDDTLMENVIIRRILTTGALNREGLILDYCDFATSNSWTLGRNTRALFHGIKTVRGYESRYVKADLSNNQSNGSLMRAAGLIHLFFYYPEEQVRELIKMDCALSNPSDVNVEINSIYLTLLQMLFNDQPLDEIKDYLSTAAQTEPVKKVIDEVLKYEHYSAIINGKDKGWVIHAFGCALDSLFLIQNHTYGEVMENILQKKGDTDTNMKIAGSLIGMFLGYEKLSQNQEENIKILTETDYTQGADINISREDTPRYMIDLIHEAFKDF